MKKRMFAALLAVSMMIGMTACGSDNSSAGNSASGSSTETAKSDNAVSRFYMQRSRATSKMQD